MYKTKIPIVALDKPHVTTVAMTWIVNERENQQIIVLSFD
jgi:hypothetical protein